MTELLAASGTMSQAPSFSELRERMRGRLLSPGDEDYEEARHIFNSMIDRYPAAIAQVIDAQDVSVVVNYAREHAIPVTVRSGGHNVAGHAVHNDALMIDLSSMKSVDVDADKRMARVGGGARLGEMIEAMEKYGFVTPTGTDNDTGVGGLTLGAGFGWLYGKYGLSIDNLLGAEIVLADGRVVHTDAQNEPDLFWAIRGGSGNFGVVTTFHFRIHPLPQTLSGMLAYPFPLAKDVLQFGRSIRETAPDELTTYAGLISTPDGQRMVGNIFCWSGDMEEGERLLAPIRAWGTPVLDTIQPMPYSKVNSLLTLPMNSLNTRDYWKQSMLRELSDGVIDTIIDFFERAPSPLTAVALTHEHGAGMRVPSDATAFPHRDSPLSVIIINSWLDPSEDAANIAWARELNDALDPFSTGGRYVNESEDERLTSVYRDNLPRLREIKARYDPGNFFRANMNIAPR